MKSKISIFCILLGAMLSQAQTRILKTIDTTDYKRTFVLKNKVYSLYNNYINVGLGIGYYSNRPELIQTIGADYNFRIKKHRLQFGGALYGIRLNDFYHGNLKLGIGGKKETKKHLLGFYYGASYNEGFKSVITDSANGAARYRSAGAYLQVQYAYKINWDYGPAISLNFDWNPERFISAIRLELFFSGAFQKKVPLEN